MLILYTYSPVIHPFNFIRWYWYLWLDYLSNGCKYLLNGEFEDVIYLDKPKGFINPNKRIKCIYTLYMV